MCIDIYIDIYTQTCVYVYVLNIYQHNTGYTASQFHLLNSLYL